MPRNPREKTDSKLVQKGNLFSKQISHKKDQYHINRSINQFDTSPSYYSIMYPYLLRFIFIILGLYACLDASIPKPVADYFNSLTLGRKQFLTMIGLYLTIIIICIQSLHSLTRILVEHTRSKRNPFINHLGASQRSKMGKSDNIATRTFTYLLIQTSNICSFLFQLMYPFVLVIQFCITISFWMLFFSDRDKLIHPVPGYDYTAPLHMEILHHVFPLLILIFEGVYTPINIDLLPFSIIIVPIYYFIAHQANKYNKKWPYPLLENISHLKRTQIFVMYGLLGVIPSFIFCYCVRKWKQRKETASVQNNKKNE